jgi:hypothetical protein
MSMFFRKVLLKSLLSLHNHLDLIQYYITNIITKFFYSLTHILLIRINLNKYYMICYKRKHIYLLRYFDFLKFQNKTNVLEFGEKNKTLFYLLIKFVIFGKLINVLIIFFLLLEQVITWVLLKFNSHIIIISRH